MSDVNIPTESAYRSSFWISIVMFPFLTISEIFAVEMYDLDLCDGPLLNVNIPTESAYSRPTFNLITLVMFYLSVTIYEIFAIEVFLTVFEIPILFN